MGMIRLFCSFRLTTLLSLFLGTRGWLSYCGDIKSGVYINKSAISRVMFDRLLFTIVSTIVDILFFLCRFCPVPRLDLQLMLLPVSSLAMLPCLSRNAH